MPRVPEPAYSTLFDALPDAVFVLPSGEGGYGKFLIVNRTACERYGYTQQEFLHLSFADLTAPEDIQSLENLREAETLSEGAGATFEATHITKSGRRFRVEVLARCTELEGERAVLASVRDITKNRGTGKISLESEAYFRLAFRAIPEAVSISRLSDGVLVDVNDRFCQLMGYRREEVLGKSSTQIRLWQDAQARERFAARLKAEGRVENVDVVFYSKEGRSIPTLLSSSIFMLNGEPHLLNIAKDISDLAEVRSRLDESEERFRKVFNASPDAIVILRVKDRRFVDVNPAFTRLTGYTRAEVLGKTAFELDLWVNREEWEAGRDVLKLGEGILFASEAVFRRKDGSYLPGIISAAAIELAGEPHVIAIVRDIKEIKQAQEALKEHEQTLHVLINATPDIICLKDGKGRWIEANEANLRLFDLEGVDYRNKTDIELAQCNPFYYDAFRTCYETDEKAWEKGTLSRGVEIIPRPDGSVRYYDVIKVPIFNEDGSRKGLVIIGRDVTSEQKARILAETIQEANLTLAASLDLHTVMETLLSHVEKLIPYDSAAIMLRQNETELTVLHTRKRGGQPDPRSLSGIVFDIRTKPHLRRIVEEKKSTFVGDTRKLIGWERIPGTEHVISWLGVPLIAGGEVIGIYSIDKSEKGYFTQEHVHLAESLAAQAATAIKNALLYKEARQRALDFATLYDASQALAGKASLDAVLNDIAQYTYRLLSSAGISIYHYDPTDQSLTIVLSTHPSVPLGTRLKLGEGMAGKVVQSRLPMRVDDYATWEGRSPQFEGDLFGAVLEVPMLYHEELVGVLCVYEGRDNPRTYTEKDERLLLLFATQAAASVHSTRLLEETRRRLARIQTLRRIDRVIAGSIDINVTLNAVLDEVVNQPGIDAAGILLLEPNTLRLKCAALRGFRRDVLKNVFLRVGEGWPGRVVLERRPLHITNIGQHPGRDRRTDTLLTEGFSAYHALPLIAKGKVKGVLEIFLRDPSERDDEWNEFLLALGGQIAIALDNSALFRNLERANLELSLAYDATIEGWSHALDLRDKETEGHTLRVTEMVLQLARAAGLEGEALVHIRRGALLHDIGKMGVPDAILHKPAPLTPEERVLMEKHPQFAYDMLSLIEYLHPALDIPYCHHEKWDGSGYPRGLKGTEIPLAARLFAVVDVYDALTSDRPYRKAWPKAKALEYIREQSGRHFDPKAVALFLRLFV